MAEGWIKIHRKIIEWEWFTDRNVFHLFMFLLLNANHEDKNWRGKTIKRGQYLTSLDKLQLKTSLSKSALRTALKKLKVTRVIDTQTTSTNTLISIINWEKYQIDDTRIAHEIAHESHTVQQTGDKRIAHTKNVKNEKNVVDDDQLFQMFRRSTGPQITDEMIIQEIGKFRNKYPNLHINQCGPVVNAWVGNIGKEEKQTQKGNFSWI